MSASSIKMKPLDAPSLKAAMVGKWIAFFRAKGYDFRQGHQPCPMHSKSTDGFRLFRDFSETGGGVCGTCGTFTDGFALYRALSGSSFRAALEMVDGFLGVSSPASLPQDRLLPIARSKSVSLIDPEVKRKNAEALSRTAGTEGSDPASKYLAGRGIPFDSAFSKALRYDIEHPYWTKGSSASGAPEFHGKHPAMIGVITDYSGEVVALHRTYLECSDDGSWGKLHLEDAKGNMLSAKKQTPFSVRPPKAPAIRLFKPGRILGIAEGIETALSCTKLMGVPTWSVMSSSFFASFDVPEGVEELVIFCDHDIVEGAEPESMIQAKRLGTLLREKGINVRIMRPKTPGQDYNDVLMAIR